MEEAVRSEKLKGGSKKEKSPNHSRSRSPIRSVIVPDNATEFDDKVVIDDDFKNEETVAATPTQASSVAITPTLGNSLGRTPAALALWSDKSCNVPAAEDAKPNPGDNHWRLLLQTFPDDHEKGGIETDGADNSLSSGLSLLSASVAMALKKGSTLKKNDSLLVAADTKQSNKANSMQNIDLDYSKFSIKIEEDHEKRGIEVQQPKQNFGGLLRTVTAKNSKHFDDNDEFLMPSSGDGNVIRSKTEKSSQAVSSSGLHNSTAYPSSHFPHKAEGNIHDELFVRQSDSKRSVTKSAKSIGNTSLLDLETNAIISKSSNATKSPRLAVHTPLAVAITISDSFSMLEDYEKGMPPIPDYSSEGLSPFVSLARKMTLPRSKSFKHAPPNITVDGPDDCPDVPELPVAFKTGSLQRKKMPTQHSRDRIIWTNSYTESPYNLSVSASRATIDRSSPALSIPLSDMKTSSTVGESELGQEDDNNDTNSPYRRLRMFISTAFCPLLPNGPTRNFWLPIVSVAYLYVLTIVPAKISFSHGLNLLDEALLTTAFSIDTIINLAIVRIDDEGLETDFVTSFFQNALSSSFVLDVVTTIPWGLILEEYGRSHHLNPSDFDWIRLVRLIRIPVIVKTPFYRKTAHVFRGLLGVGVNFMALIIFFAAMVCYIHFHACFIFFMSREANFEDAAWIPIQPQKMSFTEKYAQGVWMAMANTFFVTFKFWRPDTVPAQWCETFFCVFEAIFSASITGMISAISVGEQSPAGKFVQRLDQVKEYIRSQKIDKTNLGLRAQHGFTLKYQGKIFNEEQILGELNPWLRQEILLHGCEHILKEVPFFQRNLDDGRNELLLRMIAEILDRKSFAPGECICEQGDSGDEMFFLLEGTVSIKVHGEQIGLLNEGSYFGELSMFADILRPATLTAVTSCQCRALRRHHLLEILQDFPDISDKLIEYYQTRMAIILNSMQAE